MSTTAHPRASDGVVAVGVAQCLVLALGSLVVVTWSFIELTQQLALSTASLSSDTVRFWTMVGGLSVLVLSSVAALMLWRHRPLGFTVLGLAWVPALPLAWTTVASYLDLVPDDRMPGVVAVSLVLGGANLALTWVVRAAAPTARPPVAG